jgi:hypothetical protein
MATTRSQRNKSQLGESGLDDSNKEVAVTDSFQTMEDYEKPVIPETQVLESVQDVPVVEDSGKIDTANTLSAEDKKLADRMTREIAKYLGLSGKSRSVKL